VKEEGENKKRVDLKVVGLVVLAAVVTALVGFAMVARTSPAAPMRTPEAVSTASEMLAATPVSETTKVVLTTANVKALTGVDVQRLATEPAGWVWRAAGKTSVEATCPSGFICTWDLDDQVLLFSGPARREIIAGTWRHVKEYPNGDAVWSPCTLLAKERDFGLSETPSFKVEAGNFSCQ